MQQSDHLVLGDAAIEKAFIKRLQQEKKLVHGRYFLKQVLDENGEVILEFFKGMEGSIDPFPGKENTPYVTYSDSLRAPGGQGHQINLVRDPITEQETLRFFEKKLVCTPMFGRFHKEEIKCFEVLDHERNKILEFFNKHLQWLPTHTLLKASGEQEELVSEKDAHLLDNLSSEINEIVQKKMASKFQLPVLEVFRDFLNTIPDKKHLKKNQAIRFLSLLYVFSDTCLGWNAISLMVWRTPAEYRNETCPFEKDAQKILYQQMSPEPRYHSINLEEINGFINHGVINQSGASEVEASSASVSSASAVGFFASSNSVSESDAVASPAPKS